MTRMSNSVCMGGFFCMEIRLTKGLIDACLRSTCPVMCATAYAWCEAINGRLFAITELATYLVVSPKVALRYLTDLQGFGLIDLLNNGRRGDSKRYSVRCQGYSTEAQQTAPTTQPEPEQMSAQATSVAHVDAATEQAPSTATAEPAATVMPEVATTEAEVQFGAFWDAYPRKVKRTEAWAIYRALAIREWGRCGTVDCITRLGQSITEGARAYADKTLRDGTDTRYIAHPTTWLRGNRWQDAPQMSAYDRKWAGIKSGTAW